MTSKSETLPVIDLQGLLGGKPANRAAVDQSIGEACESIGGFMAVGLPDALQPRIAELKKLFTFFDLPWPVRHELAKREMRPESPRCMRGYVDRRSGGFAFNEIFDIGPDWPLTGPDIDAIELVTESNLWPSIEPVPGWRASMNARFLLMETLGIAIIRAISRYLAFHESAAAARYRDSSSSMRLLRYPPHAPDPKVAAEKTEAQGKTLIPLVGKAHTDNGGLTLQWQDQPGLQLQTPTGEWLDVPGRSEGLSVHLGEALETQTSRKLAATPHRVVGSNEVRHSIVFFLEPNLFSSVDAFSKGSEDKRPPADQTYAASMIDTLRRTGRA